MSYAFNSNALGFGGMMTSPQRAIIPSQASAVLASSGGFGSVTVKDFRYGNFVSIDEMRSEVYGMPQREGGFAARARVMLVNVNLTDSLHADYLEATVTSTKRPGQESEIRINAIYEGLTLFGVALDPELDCEFYNTRSFEQLNPVTTTATEASALIVHPQPEPDTVRGTLMRRPQNLPQQSVQRGVEIHVPGYGKVHVGEVIAKRQRRRLNLLRIDLKSGFLLESDTIAHSESYDGSASFGSADSNGSEIMP